MQVEADGSQGIPRDPRSPQKLAEAGKTLPWRLRRKCSPAENDCRRPAPRTGKGGISVALSPICDDVLRPSGETHTTVHRKFPQSASIRQIWRFYSDTTPEGWLKGLVSVPDLLVAWAGHPQSGQKGSGPRVGSPVSVPSAITNPRLPFLRLGWTCLPTLDQPSGRIWLVWATAHQTPP